MDPAPNPLATAAFGRFQVVPHRRELLADGKPLKLGGRAFDVLMTLLEAPGAIVSKDVLIARVWPNRVVEESALHVQIAALRAALGREREFIRTVIGRGYQFTGDLRPLPAANDEHVDRSEDPAEPQPAMPPTNLPEPVSELIGRDEELHEIVNLAASHRLVTLTGAGGIGKTRLALAVARRLLPRFADGVWIAEFSPLGDPGLVPATVANAAGLELGGGQASPQLVAQAIAGQRLLLVLDTCEHVIADASALAEAVLRAGPAVCVIATSREPLRAEGEWIYPVPPLAVPRAATGDQYDPQQYGAVRLFVERAQALSPQAAPDLRRLSMVAAICRRLDGMPLAIELAASRAAALGVEEVAARLDDRFRLLTGGRRLALPRHQTLRAALDWSYELLPEPETAVLRRLAVFAGVFTLTAAREVVASTDLPTPDVVEGVANLIAKSLVATDIEGSIVRYRLLDTMRAYAREKLIASGEFQVVARRHAEFVQGSFGRIESEQGDRPMPERLADYGREINDVRAALDWAFSPDGDANLGVALTAASERLWFGLSLMDECRRRFETALSILRQDVIGDTRLEMRMSAALGAALYYAKGPCLEARAAWADVLAVAERLDDSEHRLRALWGLWSYHAGNGELQAALTVAQRLVSLPRDQAGPTDLLVGQRLLGSTLHFLGDLSNARSHLEHVLGHSPASIAQPRSDTSRFEWSRQASARGSLVPVLWLQGFPDQAMAMARAYVEDAHATGHQVSLCWALYAACPIALATGDLATAERFVAMLLERSSRHAPGFLQALAHGLHGELLIKRGEADGGVQRLRIALDELRASGFVLRRPALLGALAEGLAAAGRVAEGLQAIKEALAQCERSEEMWNMAELLRIEGELLWLEGTPQAIAAAEDRFRQALVWARRQEASSWELRCATSFARLLNEQRRTGEARQLLSAAYDRFTEGFETADLKAAKALLASLPDLPAQQWVEDGCRQ